MANKVILVGRVGKDPEVRHFDGGSSVANFSLATGEKYKDKQGNRQEITDWHNIAVWRGGLVKVVEQYVKKGDKLYIEGKLRTRSWDNNNGGKSYTTEVIVEVLEMHSPKSSNNQQQNTAAPANYTPPVSTTDAVDDVTDDLPF